MADASNEIKGAAKDTARTIGDELREKGAEAAEAATNAARKQAENARDEVYARGEYYRDYAAEETDKVASALRRASRDLNSGSPQEQFVGQIADGVADAADRMRGMTLADTAREAEDFARRHPAAFLGAAALLGFATARFLKASSHDDARLYLPQTGTSDAPAPGSPKV